MKFRSRLTFPDIKKTGKPKEEWTCLFSIVDFTLCLAFLPSHDDLLYFALGTRMRADTDVDALTGRLQFGALKGIVVCIASLLCCGMLDATDNLYGCFRSQSSHGVGGTDRVGCGFTINRDALMVVSNVFVRYQTNQNGNPVGEVLLYPLLSI